VGAINWDESVGNVCEEEEVESLYPAAEEGKAVTDGGKITKAVKDATEFGTNEKGDKAKNGGRQRRLRLRHANLPNASATNLLAPLVELHPPNASKARLHSTTNPQAPLVEPAAKSKRLLLLKPSQPPPARLESCRSPIQ